MFVLEIAIDEVLHVVVEDDELIPPMALSSQAIELLTVGVTAAA